MASLSSVGVSGTGLDESVITKLVAIEKQPADALTTKNTTLQTKVSTWGKIQSAFSSLKDAANKLTQSEFWNGTTATSSNDTAVSVSTTSSAAASAYAVTVSQLAQSQMVATSAFASKTAAVGEGTLRIQLGTYVTDNSVAPPAVTFNAKAAASAVDIAIGPGDNTLEKIRDRINSSNAGITASIVNDASGSRLVMRGANGETNAFKVSVTENGAVPGLSALAYDGTTGGTSSMTRTQAAQNAKATINGLAVSSESNTLSDVVDGVTLTLKQATATPANITVAQDTASISKGVSDFISAYNNVVSTIRVQTLYDEASKTAGPLQGDSTARGLLSQMRNLITSDSTATASFSRLFDMGIVTNTDGTLKMTSSKFNDAMGTKLADMQKYFANSDDVVASKNGMGQRIKNLASQILDTNGAIANSTDGLKATIKRNTTKIDSINDRAGLYEARLRQQYTALDASYSKLSGLQSYVSAQLAALNKS
jgi:flagellar hook-associated protein 2